MAEAPYLKDYFVRCDWDTNAKTLGAAKGMEYNDARIALMTRITGLDPLTSIIASKLRKAKRVISPTLTRAQSRIVAIPVGAPYMKVNGAENRFPTLCSDYMWDPEDIIDFPIDAKALGEKAIEIVEDFLHMAKFPYKPQFIDGFPFDIFEEAIEEFRREGYALRWRDKQASIIRTTLKADFIVKCSGEETTVKLAILYRKKELFRRHINTFRGGMISQANGHYVQLMQSGLSISNALNGHPVQIIPFTDLPDEVLAHFK